MSLQQWENTKMARYRLISYDVWGNSKDGWWVNDLFATGIYIDIAEDYSDYRINRLLKVHGVKYVRQWGHEDYLYAENKSNGKPLFELRPCNE